MSRSRWLVLVGYGLVAMAASVAGPACEAQEPAPAAAKPAASGPGAGTVAELGTRFHLGERYTTEEKGKEAIGQYRVAVRETIKVSEERPQAAPARHEGTSQVIYSERAAKVGGNGAVLAAVRRYEAFRRAPEPSAKPSTARPLEGLTLWYQPGQGSGGDPLVLSLSERRGLREADYIEASRQVFLPELAAALPALPVRVGDRWSLSKLGARALLGVAPGRGEPVTGVLQEVHQVAKGPDWEAVIAITGRPSLPIGETSVNARIVFTFSPAAPAAEPDSARPRDGDNVVAGRGAITELRMAAATTSLLPGGNGRLRRTSTRELFLVRQLATSVGPLAIPDPPPTATEANSWLTYDDPGGKFHFRHPQDFHQGPLTGGDVVELLRSRLGGLDRIEIQRQPRTGDPQADRENRNPDFHVKTLAEIWRQQKNDVLRGPTGWLPEADWTSFKMKVYRINAALRAGGPSAKGDARIHYDAYVVLFGSDESLFVQSTTIQDPPTPFRKQVEAILKTFQLEASGGTR